MSCDLVSGHVMSCDLPPFLPSYHPSPPFLSPSLPSHLPSLLLLVRSGVVSECNSSSLSSSSSLSHENAFLSRNDSFRMAVLEVGVCVLLAPATKRNFSPSLFPCFPPLFSVHTFRTESAGQYLRPNPSHYLLLLFLLPGMLVRQGAHQTTKKGMSLIPVTPCSRPHEHWSWFHVDGSRPHDTLVLGSM